MSATTSLLNANLRSHGRRYISTGLAVAISTAFIAITLIVNSLGIANRLSHRPSEMSGGQQQRVAVARALMSRPAVIVADEPTGNLDSHSTDEVMDLLRRAVDELSQSVIMVTHDTATAAYADRVLVCRDGRIVSDLRDVTADSLTAALR